MSGLFKRLSGRRSAGPDGSESPTAAEHGTADAPATPTAESGGHKSLLTDPAAPTRPLREGDRPAAAQPAADPNAHTIFGVPAPAPAPAESATPVYGPSPPVYDAATPPPIYRPAPDPNVPAPFAAPVVPVEPVADLPAGLDPDELAAAPGTSARRGKLRRRIAFLRAARELLLRDLGGFIYELHRTAHDIEHEAHRRLRDTKLARLSRVDAELHELEYRLDDVRRQVLVREPGVGGECAHCGELFASAAHYCSNCGNPLTESARRELAKAQAPGAEAQPEAQPEAKPRLVAVEPPTQEIGPLEADRAEPDFKWPSRDAADAPSGLDLRKRPSGETSTVDEPSVAPVGETGADAPTTEAPAETGAETAAAHADETPAAPDESPVAPVGETGADSPAVEAPAETGTDAAATTHPDETPAAAADENPAAPVGETGADAPGAEAPTEAAATAHETPAAADESPVAPVGETGADAPAAEAAAAVDAGESPAASDDASAAEADATTDEARPDTPTADGMPGDDAPAPPSDDPQRARNGSAPDDSILRPVERRQ